MATAADVADYFLFLDCQHEGEGISNLKLQKLMYYAQGFYLALFDEELFPDEIEAWTHGPVVPSIYHLYKDNGSDLIPAVEEIDESAFSEKEVGLLGEVFDVFGQYSAWKLRNMTHEEEPWLNYERLAGVIPKEDLREYFTTRLN